MARQRILPNLENCTEAELRIAMRCSPTQKGFIRCQALIYYFKNYDLDTIANLSNISKVTMRRWVKLFNNQGVDGLIENKHKGRPKKISLETRVDIVTLLDKKIEEEETVWTAKKLHAHMNKEMQVFCSYRSVVRMLHEEKYSLQVPRPWPAQRDEEKCKKFRKELLDLLNQPNNEIWFQDEMGVEGDPRPRRRWVKRNSKPKAIKNSTHIRTSVCGMVCPRTGEFFSLELPYSDTITFQIFLDEANKTLDLSKKTNYMVLDNASWHKVKTLKWGRLTPLYLPPYSPDLNPIERLWKALKDKFFNGFYAKDYPQLSNRICLALRYYLKEKTQVQSICKIHT
jgi:transposase